jgi:hypothetical protein
LSGIVLDMRQIFSTGGGGGDVFFPYDLYRAHRAFLRSQAVSGLAVIQIHNTTLPDDTKLVKRFFEKIKFYLNAVGLGESTRHASSGSPG